MKKIIIPVVIIIILIGISCIIFIPKKSIQNSTDKNNVVKEETNIEENKTIEVESEIDNNVIEESVIVDNNQNINDENKKQEEIKEEKEVISTETVDKEISKSNPVEEKPKLEETVPKTEEVKPKTAWEDLGISEYDYYHKPMWSWARIDFSIEVYKTYEKTREACISKGEEYFEQGLGYSCTGINSYSGDYLGEMLKTF